MGGGWRLTLIHMGGSGDVGGGGGWERGGGWRLTLIHMGGGGGLGGVAVGVGVGLRGWGGGRGGRSNKCGTSVIGRG